MKLIFNIFIFCFVFLQSTASKSQSVTATVESDSILIGKELEYVIDVNLEKKDNIIFPDSTSFTPFELISETKVDTIENESGYLFSKKYGIISFDEGNFIIPKIKVKIGDKLFSTDSKKITVNLVEVDTTKQGLYDIKSSFDKFSSFEIFKLGLKKNYPIILFIIFFTIILFYFRLKVFEFFNPLLNIQPSLRPIELIQERMNELEKINIYSAKDIKLFYSKLTFALRSFFEKEVYDKALESTTSELIFKLNNLSEIKSFSISIDSIKRIEEILKRADLVKFAKFLPEKNVIQNDLKVINEEVRLFSDLLPEPSEEEKLKNLNYLKQAEKKLKIERVKIVSIFTLSFIFILFIFSGLLYGFQYSLDKITFNENLRLLNKTWVKSEYGSPGIFVESPDVLVRKNVADEFLYDDFSLDSQFYFINSNRSIEFFISNYSFESKIDPKDFQTILELNLDYLEKRGLQNMLIKYDEFKTNNKARGILISGTTDFKIKGEKIRPGNYNILGFLNEKGFKTAILLTHDSSYIDNIKDRIINSIEVLKEDKK
ncbi:MAG: hypothetical protein CMC51_05425 [Flavobacteriaceae bacterium]|nr:hypothetical protein [Flavobacteriaceae bacterium]|tara:strand:- start:573 stop:2204 length:1632 start_codon:yes stop_codon:yes gene_type:complete